MLDTALAAKGLKVMPCFQIKDRLRILAGGIEPDVAFAAKRWLGPGCVALDIGANIGIVTQVFSKLVGSDGRVFSFEPDPEVFDVLSANARNWANTRACRLAISDKDCSATFHLSDRSSTNNSLLFRGTASRSIVVQCRSLDSLWTELGVSRLDLVKIDVEGAELLALAGMTETLKRFPGVRFIIEYAPENLRGSGVQPEEFFRRLKEMGLQLSALKPGEQAPISEFEEMARHLSKHGYFNLGCAFRT